MYFFMVLKPTARKGELVPTEAARENPLYASPLTAGGLLAFFGAPWLMHHPYLCLGFLVFSLGLFPSPSPCAGLFLCLSFPFYEHTVISL